MLHLSRVLQLKKAIFGLEIAYLCLNCNDTKSKSILRRLTLRAEPSTLYFNSLAIKGNFTIFLEAWHKVFEYDLNLS